MGFFGGKFALDDPYPEAKAKTIWNDVAGALAGFDPYIAIAELANEFDDKSNLIHDKDGLLVDCGGGSCTDQNGNPWFYTRADGVTVYDPRDDGLVHPDQHQRNFVMCGNGKDMMMNSSNYTSNGTLMAPLASSNVTQMGTTVIDNAEVEWNRQHNLNPDLHNPNMFDSMGNLIMHGKLANSSALTVNAATNSGSSYVSFTNNNSTTGTTATTGTNNTNSNTNTGTNTNSMTGMTLASTINNQNSSTGLTLAAAGSTPQTVDQYNSQVVSGNIPGPVYLPCPLKMVPQSSSCSCSSSKKKNSHSRGRKHHSKDRKGRSSMKGCCNSCDQANAIGAALYQGGTGPYAGPVGSGQYGSTSQGTPLYGPGQPYGVPIDSSGRQNPIVGYDVNHYPIYGSGPSLPTTTTTAGADWVCGGSGNKNYSDGKGGFVQKPGSVKCTPGTKGTDPPTTTTSGGIGVIRAAHSTNRGILKNKVQFGPSRRGRLAIEIHAIHGSDISGIHGGDPHHVDPHTGHLVDPNAPVVGVDPNGNMVTLSPGGDYSTDAATGRTVYTDTDGNSIYVDGPLESAGAPPFDPNAGAIGTGGVSGGSANPPYGMILSDGHYADGIGGELPNPPAGTPIGSGPNGTTEFADGHGGTFEERDPVQQDTRVTDGWACVRPVTLSAINQAGGGQYGDFGRQVVNSCIRTPDGPFPTRNSCQAVCNEASGAPPITPGYENYASTHNLDGTPINTGTNGGGGGGTTNGGGGGGTTGGGGTSGGSTYQGAGAPHTSDNVGGTGGRPGSEANFGNGGASDPVGPDSNVFQAFTRASDDPTTHMPRYNDGHGGFYGWDANGHPTHTDAQGNVEYANIRDPNGDIPPGAVPLDGTLANPQPPAGKYKPGETLPGMPGLIITAAGLAVIGITSTIFFLASGGPSMYAAPPGFGGGNMTTCPVGQHYDTTQKKCVPDATPPATANTCMPGYKYDTTIHMCIPDGSMTNTNGGGTNGGGTNGGMNGGTGGGNDGSGTINGSGGMLYGPGNGSGITDPNQTELQCHTACCQQNPGVVYYDNNGFYGDDSCSRSRSRSRSVGSRSRSPSHKRSRSKSRSKSPKKYKSCREASVSSMSSRGSSKSSRSRSRSKSSKGSKSSKMSTGSKRSKSSSKRSSSSKKSKSSRGSKMSNGSKKSKGSKMSTGSKKPKHSGCSCSSSHKKKTKKRSSSVSSAKLVRSKSNNSIKSSRSKTSRSAKLVRSASVTSKRSKASKQSMRSKVSMRSKGSRAKSVQSSSRKPPQVIHVVKRPASKQKPARKPTVKKTAAYYRAKSEQIAQKAMKMESKGRGRAPASVVAAPAPQWGWPQQQRYPPQHYPYPYPYGHN